MSGISRADGKRRAPEAARSTMHAPETTAEDEPTSEPTGEIDTLYHQVRQAHGITDPVVQPAEQGDDPAAAPSRHREHAPGILVHPLRTPTLPPATHTNCYLMGAAELVVVDPSSPHPEERDALDRTVDALATQGRHVVEIWLTHHHADHVSGARHLAGRLGVPIAAHARTAELLRGRVPVDRHIADGEVRVLAGEPPRPLRAVHTPGHAPGHLCFVDEHTGALVAGDMVAGVGTILVEPSEGNMRQYLDSLRRMKALAPTALLPAHGPSIDHAQTKLDEYIRHRLWREARVVDALGRLGPIALDPLVREVYADVPPAVHPLAVRSLLAHLIALAEDGRAIAERERWRLP